MRLADYVIESLKLLDQMMFFVPGGACLPLADAIGKNQMPFVCTFGEQSAGWAAYARARMNGIGLCLSSSGPAATNLVTSINGCWQDSIPVFFLTGQVSSKEYKKDAVGLRQQGWLGVNVVDIVKNITKYCAYVERPENIRLHLELAYEYMYLGRPGPVLLDIPFDLQGVDVDLPLPEFRKSGRGSCGFSEIIEALKDSKRPLVLAGHGINVAGMAKQLRRLAEQINVPVVTTPLGMDAMEYASRQYVGLCGVCGTRAGNFAVQDADVILSLGNSMHVRTTGYAVEKFAPNAKIIQVDLDRPHLLRPDVLHVAGDVSLVIDELIKSDFVFRGEWVDHCVTLKEKYDNSHEPHKRSSDKINQYDFVNMLNDFSEDDTVYVTSAGMCPHIIPQALKIRGEQRLIAYSDGAMGFTVPGIIGLCSAGKKVVAIAGDGDFMINNQELQVIKYHEWKPKIFIMNNHGYASIRNAQMSMYQRNVGSSEYTGLSFPVIRRIAEAYAIKYEACHKETMLQDIARVMSQNQAVICEVFAMTDQVVMPKAVAQLQADGTMKPSALDAMSPTWG